MAAARGSESASGACAQRSPLGLEHIALRGPLGLGGRAIEDHAHAQRLRIGLVGLVNRSDPQIAGNRRQGGYLKTAVRPELVQQGPW